MVVGSWTDGLFFFGQRPGRAGRLAKLPVIDGKKAAVYCTYAVNAGKTLPQAEPDRSGRRGGDVIGGCRHPPQATWRPARSEFVDRLLGALDGQAS